MKENIRRIEWIDVLRFLGIFAIYIGHFASASGKLYPFVYEYHVPLFFLASGFFIKYKEEEKYSNILIKKFKHLMFPYFCLTFLYSVIYCIANNSSITTLLTCVKEIFLGIRNTAAVDSAWFLTCLFVVLLIYNGFMKIFKGNKIYVVSCSIVCFLVSSWLLPTLGMSVPHLFWNIDVAFYYIIYVAIGNVLYSYIKNFDFDKLDIYAKHLIKFFEIFCIAFAVIVYFKGSNYFLSYIGVSNSLFLVIWELFKTLILIYANIIIAKSLVKISVLSQIGQNTLYLCALEAFWKTAAIHVFALFSLNVNFLNPLSVVIYSFILILSANYTIIPFLKKYFSKLMGEN